MAQGKVVSRPDIRCMNVTFSPNLGDGLLSECLEAELRAQGAGPATGSIDLAARNGYGQALAGRGAIMAALDALPSGMRNLAVRAPLALAARRKWAPHYAAGLEGASAVVIGGGNLLSDHDLNFPTKLALALDAAFARELPVGIYACGMGARWSAEGDRRLRRALRRGRLRAVFLRDEQSAARWNARFADTAEVLAEVVRDPGLLARDTYGAAPEHAGAAPVIGLGIMSHVAIRYHGAAGPGEAALRRWYVDLARALRRQGAEVVAFTNGAPEDRAAAQLLQPDLAQLGVTLRQPSTPADLSAIIAGCDAIAAYRMHAVIAAYSHAVPALALSWDDKLDAFVASVGREDWIADPADMNAETAAARLLQAAKDGIDPVRHAAVIAEARADVGKVIAALGDASGR